MNKVNKSIIFLLVMVGVLLISVIFLLYSQGKFDRETWMEKPDERVKMVDHFLTHNNLKGKTKRQIISLLGQPNDDGYSKENNNIVYYLGDEKGFFESDSEWLVIWFDKQEKVNKYELQWN